jgi:GT2 family glycosyltransferase
MSGVTLIIPNWNGERWLDRLLASVERQTVRPDAVLVVDNGSTDSSCDVASRRGASLVRLDGNRGFSRAVNEGIRATATSWVAVVNNDVELDSRWLEALLDACREEESWFACCRLLRMGDHGVLDGAFDLLSRSGCAWRAGAGSPDGEAWRRPRRVHFAPLTATLLRRELFERAGLLDESFESYLEDVEFGLRCALQGLSGLYVPDSVAFHHGSATLGAWSGAMVRLLSRNQALLVARHYPRDWFVRYGRPVLAGQILWGLAAFRRGRGGAWLRGKLDAVRAWSSVRREPDEEAAARLAAILSSSEQTLHELVDGGDSFWRWYFRLAGGVN